jgi:hypothetical protein
MTVVLRSQQPLRLFGVFAAALGAFALIAAAAYAVLYIVENETAKPAPPPAPAADFDLPQGMVVIRPTDLGEWEEVLGFAPVVAAELPDGVVDMPLYFLQPPDATFGVAGHVRYAYMDGRPAISLIEQVGGLDTDSPMKAVESADTRVHIVNLPCGEIVIQAQMFFQGDGPDAPTPKDSSATAGAFFDSLRDHCGGLPADKPAPGMQ